jgi:RNA polymerase sigma factor (TIGR02999 family)
MSDVTRILKSIEDGDQKAAEELLPLVYDELRKLAAAKLAQEKPGQTLQATALVHEAYIRLVDVDQAQHSNSRGHFFGAAAQAMRRILVDNARRKQSLKEGGDVIRHSVSLDQLNQQETSDELLALDDALHSLSVENPPVARLVELKYFGGLTLDEAATALEISVRTAHRYWAYAKAWLHNAVFDVQNDR